MCHKRFYDLFRPLKSTFNTQNPEFTSNTQSGNTHVPSADARTKAFSTRGVFTGPHGPHGHKMRHPKIRFSGAPMRLQQPTCSVLMQGPRLSSITDLNNGLHHLHHVSMRRLSVWTQMDQAGIVRSVFQDDVGTWTRSICHGGPRMAPSNELRTRLLS